MPRGGKNRSGGGGKFRARRTVYFFPPLGNFSCTPLSVIDHYEQISLYTKSLHMAGNISITDDDIMRVCTFAALIFSILLITNFVRPNSAQGPWIVRQYEGRALDIRRISTFSKNKLGPKGAVLFS